MKSIIRPRLGPREVVYRNSYHRVYSVRANFDGYAKRYFVTDYGSRVGVLAIKGGDILMVRQYRLLINRVSWEIPGGRVDAGESARRAAIRECLEESGVRCRRLHRLIAFEPGLDTLHNPTQIYFTTELVEQPCRGLHRGEVEEHAWVPLRRCVEMVNDGTIVDSLSMIALLEYSRRISNRPAHHADLAGNQLRVQF